MNTKSNSVLLSSKVAKSVAKEIAADVRDDYRAHRINIWGTCSCGATFHDDDEESDSK